MKKYGNTEWQYMAAMARDYASKMQSNKDVDAETGKYIYAIVDEYDRNASSVLKSLYESEGVESVDIYTEQGGYQTIRVKYTDGTEYNFDTNGSHDSLDDMVCNEIYAYITGRIDESKSNRNMKTENRKRNVVRLTESKLKQIVVESVKRVLREEEYISDEDWERLTMSDAEREEEYDRRRDEMIQATLKAACDELLHTFWNNGATLVLCDYFLKYISDRIRLMAIDHPNGPLAFNGAS